MALTHKLDKHTARLGLSYLVIIMFLSTAFSIVFFRTSADQLARQLPPDSFYVQIGPNRHDFSQFFEQRISEGRAALLHKLILLNLLVLILGAAISYYLARRSLRPIEEAMDAQGRFSSDASHELRTPLTAIRTRNEVALRKPRLSAAAARDVIKSNLAEAIKLEKLSEGLLSLGQEDGKNLKLAPVAFDEVVTEALNQVVKAAQAKRISIVDKVSKTKVPADKAGLVQVLTILLDNAIKYSPAKSAIDVEGYRKGKYGYLVVRDRGEGIRASDIPHIFERFFRSDPSRTKRKANGHGLGLSIAQKIIEQHPGGEISVQSKLGQGSTFTVRLPLA